MKPETCSDVQKKKENVKSLCAEHLCKNIPKIAWNNWLCKLFFLILAIWLMYSLSFLLLGEIGLKLPKDPLCSLVSYYICVLSKQWGVFGAFLLKKTLPPVRKMALKRTIRVKQSSILVRDQFKDGTKLKNPKQNCKDNSLWIDHFQDSKLILFFFNIRDQSSHFEVLTCSHCFPLALWKSFLFALHSLTSLNLSVPSC